MKIVKKDGFTGTSERRLYLEGFHIAWKCACGAEHSKEIHKDEYFYHDMEAGKPTDMTLYCSECADEKTVKIQLNICLELV